MEFKKTKRRNVTNEKKHYMIDFLNCHMVKVIWDDFSMINRRLLEKNPILPLTNDKICKIFSLVWGR